MISLSGSGVMVYAPEDTTQEVMKRRGTSVHGVSGKDSLKTPVFLLE